MRSILIESYLFSSVSNTCYHRKQLDSEASSTVWIRGIEQTRVDYDSDILDAFPAYS